MNSNDRILIVGTGAMACLFAARLTEAGIQVQMLGNWEGALRAFEEIGVRLVNFDGNSRTYQVQISSDPKDFPGTQVALVLVKSWQTKSAAERLSECLDADGIALTLQNGLGNYEILVDVLGRDRVMVGTTTAGATLVEAGVVRPAGKGKISLGSHPSQRILSCILQQAGFQLETVENIDSLVWGKLVINSAINPLTAVLNIRNGALLDLEPARELMILVARETASVALGLGIQLLFSDPGAAAERVAQDTEDNRSSMLQDMTRGAPTEIDAICGQIVRTGRKIGIPTPLNDALLKLVKARLASIHASPVGLNEAELIRTT